MKGFKGNGEANKHKQNMFKKLSEQIGRITGISSIFLMLFVMGCYHYEKPPTPYQIYRSAKYKKLVTGEDTPEGGYKTKYLGNDTYEITIVGNIYTESYMAREYFHRRKKEITKNYGYKRCSVIDLNVTKKKKLKYLYSVPLGENWIKEVYAVYYYPVLTGKIKCVRE